MTVPDKVSPALARAIQHEQACQQSVASLTQKSMSTAGLGSAAWPDDASLDERLIKAHAEWQEALDVRRRLEEEHVLLSELERLRSEVATKRSGMSRWERWREARRFRREW